MAPTSSSTKNALPSARVDDVGDLGLAHRVGVQPVDQAAHVPGQQRLELHPLDAGQPGPLADLAAQRVAAVQVVGAVGHDEGDPAWRRGGRRGS